VRDGYGTLVGDVVEIAHDDPAELSRVLDELGDRVAAFIGEPVIGAGGVIPPPDGYWPEIERICRERDVLLICDEVISGFGRLGTWFGCERYGFTPDLMTCAKGISSGYAPLSAVVVSGRVREPFWREDAAPFLHGGTYSGHPVACVAGLVNLDILEREGLVERVRALEPVLREVLEPIRSEDGVADVRSVGLAAAVELDADLVAANPGVPMAAALGARRRGVLTRAIRGVALQISPPFVITEDELATIAEAVRAGVREAVAATRA
jgi:adenosylmethionine-8-amino-7-oxononanoate aminotransferase